jgi:hypothetical protein
MNPLNTGFKTIINYSFKFLVKYLSTFHAKPMIISFQLGLAE